MYSKIRCCLQPSRHSRHNESAIQYTAWRACSHSVTTNQNSHFTSFVISLILALALRCIRRCLSWRVFIYDSSTSRTIGNFESQAQARFNLRMDAGRRSLSVWRYRICCVLSIALNIFLWLSQPAPHVPCKVCAECNPPDIFPNGTDVVVVPYPQQEENQQPEEFEENVGKRFAPKRGEDVMVWESFDDEKFYSSERTMNVRSILVCHFKMICNAKKKSWTFLPVACLS